jgi:GNAT superfamily N-acetyltransferase
MPASAIERITAFDHRFARAQASTVAELSWGFAVLQAAFPFSERHNRIFVTTAASAADVLATTEQILGDAGVSHRYVSVDGVVDQTWIAEFVAAGYSHETIVTMIHSGAELEPGAHEVQAVSLETMRPTLICDWRIEIPDATDEELGQLADRTALYDRGADLTRLAVYEGDEIAAHADLYVDRVDSIAQFESLLTHSDFRGRGYADALIRDALQRGRAAGSDLSFLTAALDDWPREWYQRLGYVDAGREHHFRRE